MFWIRSCKTLLGEADTAKKFQSNMLAEMMLALTDLCEHFCSTWPSVVVGVCVCVCASSLCVCVHWPTQILLFFFFPSSVQTTQILISCFPTHILTTVWFTPASNKQQPLNSLPVLTSLFFTHYFDLYYTFLSLPFFLSHPSLTHCSLFLSLTTHWPNRTQRNK